MIKKATTLFVVTLALTLSGCGAKSGSTSSAQPSAQNISDAQPQSKVVMPKVKYPAAIVFEGGKGDAWLDENNSKHTPAWRLYICLENTTQPLTGQVPLDLAQLGTQLQQTFDDIRNLQPLYTEKLSKVVLNYTYTTELSDDLEHNDGFAWGNAAITIQSQQIWELVSQNTNEHYTHQSYSDFNFFNIKTTDSSLAAFSQHNYSVNGETFYVLDYLKRFTFSQKDNRSGFIEVCEKANQPYVLQVGSEITPTK